MEIEVLKFDNLGRGIGYLNNKIIFIPKTVPGDIVTVNIVKDKKKYYEGKLVKIIKPAKIRIEPICPYFSRCGGCDLMQISISNGLEYKLNKINDTIKHNGILYQVKEIIKSSNQYYYRNKITLKIVNGKVGFYETNSHLIVEINHCYLCSQEINKVIQDIKLLEIKNGEVIIRCNYKNEILLIINGECNVNNLEVFNQKFKLTGIILNNKLIYGSPFLMDKVGDYLFKVSYNAFFQVNPSICVKLFQLIEENTKNSHHVLDLYCGVGTLSIVTSRNAKKVLGVEIVKNAILDAQVNKEINNAQNCEFICADTQNILDKITSNYDTIILDPPRNGVTAKVLNKIMIENIPKIIYVSCNPLTLVRDLKLLLTKYTIQDFKLLDMFANTEHVESIVILKINKT